MQGNIVAIHNVLKKNCIAKFSTSSIFKKIGKDNLKKNKKKKKSILEKKKHVKKKGEQKQKKKNMWGKLLCVVETLQQSTMLFLKKLRN